MNRYNFLQTGGFPFETDVLDGMQKAFEIFNCLGALAGNLTILSGCIISGSNISNGFVHINGEIYPFIGGAIQASVVIETQIQTAEFEDLSTKEIQYKKYVQFGTGVGSFLWTNFTRPATTTQLTNLIEGLTTRVEDLEARPQAIPIGLIAIWDRPANDIPIGWEEHQPLRGRMPIGLDPNYAQNTDVVNYALDTLSFAGGVRDHKLTVAEIPAHSHSFTADNWNIADGLNFGSNTQYQTGSATQNTSNSGGDGKHTNMQPYRIVHFIKYTGV